MLTIAQSVKMQQRAVNSRPSAGIGETTLMAINGDFVMKAITIAMIVAINAAGTVAANSHDPEFKVFTMCMLGGMLGMLAGVCCYKPIDLQSLARECAGNFSLALAFGPQFTFLIASHLSFEPTVYTFVATSAGLGIFGLTLVKSIGPWLITQLKTATSGFLKSKAGS